MAGAGMGSGLCGIGCGQPSMAWIGRGPGSSGLGAARSAQGGSGFVVKATFAEKGRGNSLFEIPAAGGGARSGWPGLAWAAGSVVLGAGNHPWPGLAGARARPVSGPRAARRAGVDSSSKRLSAEKGRGNSAFVAFVTRRREGGGARGGRGWHGQRALWYWVRATIHGLDWPGPGLVQSWSRPQRSGQMDPDRKVAAKMTIAKEQTF